jgi:predicted DNA-binding transcriptional regulator YafY
VVGGYRLVAGTAMPPLLLDDEEAVAIAVAGRLGDAPGELEALDEHSCRLHSRAESLEWLAFRLAMLGCEFEVHEPPELAEYLRALGARVTRAAGGAP